MKAVESVGFWWNDQAVDVYKINGKFIAVSGWNGEEWLDCWQVSECVNGRFYKIVPGGDCSVRPIYRFQAENIDLDSIEENSGEWDCALEIVDFDASSK